MKAGALEAAVGSVEVAEPDMDKQKRERPGGSGDSRSRHGLAARCFLHG
jgi:hypothetical protein